VGTAKGICDGILRLIDLVFYMNNSVFAASAGFFSGTAAILAPFQLAAHARSNHNRFMAATVAAFAFFVGITTVTAIWAMLFLLTHLTASFSFSVVCLKERF
jgi:hypothetical protein